MTPGTSPADRFWQTVYRLGYPCARRVWRLTGPRTRGVAIAVRHGQRLLCIRESYRRGLALPGGGIERGETPAAAARRELREEVGLDLPAAAFAELGLFEYAFHDRVHATTFFELGLDAPLAPTVDRREIVWAGWLAPPELARAERQPAIDLYLQHRAAD